MTPLGGSAVIVCWNLVISKRNVLCEMIYLFDKYPYNKQDNVLFRGECRYSTIILIISPHHMAQLFIFP